MASLTAFLYPGCTSCQKAKSWLADNVGHYLTRHIYDEPPTRSELRHLAELLPGGAQALLSRRSRRFRELGFSDDPSRLPESEEALLDLLADEPRLLRRPIVTDGKRAVVGWSEAAFVEEFGGSARARR